MQNYSNERDDQDLLQRILRGDDVAFSFLVEKYHARVFRLVRGIIGDWHQSEDVCQEIFSLIFRKIAGFQQRSQLSTWIYRVALHAALKARRRRKELRARPLEAALDIPASADPPGKRLEGDEFVKKLLAPLPQKLRAVVTLREHLGLSYAEIAEVLGISRGAVEQRLHRAMVALRDIWRSSGLEDRMR